MLCIAFLALVSRCVCTFSKLLIPSIHESVILQNFAKCLFWLYLKHVFVVKKFHGLWLVLLQCLHKGYYFEGLWLNKSTFVKLLFSNFSIHLFIMRINSNKTLPSILVSTSFNSLSKNLFPVSVKLLYHAICHDLTELLHY